MENTKLDFENIIRKSYIHTDGVCVDAKFCMQEAIKKALPIILQYAAENCIGFPIVNASGKVYNQIDKESITLLESDKELLTKLGL